MSFGELYFLICQCLFSPVYYVTCSLYVHPFALSMPVFFDGSVSVSSLWEMYFWCPSFLYLSHVYSLDLLCEFWRTVFLWSVNVCFLRSVSTPIVSMSIPLLCQCSYSLMVLYLFLVSLSICLWVCSHSYLSSACLSLRLCVDMFLRVMFVWLCLRADLGRVRIVRVFSTCQMCVFLIWSVSFREL